MLDREEYIEQSHLFRLLVERLADGIPIQELLWQAKEETLATTRLPLAIDFLLTELKHLGTMSSAMRRLPHYFTSFQSFVVEEAEKEGGRFDMRVALEVLREEARYRSGQPVPAGIFLYQLETLSRNRLRYDPGLLAVSQDPLFDPAWRDWILTVRRQVGIVDLADLIYVRSEYYRRRRAGRGEEERESVAVLFGEKEGKIAFANRRKDPLYLFAALQRHLDYPAVPRLKPVDKSAQMLPLLLRRLDRLEQRIKLLEEEQRGGIDLSQFLPGGQPPKS